MKFNSKEIISWFNTSTAYPKAIVVKCALFLYVFLADSSAILDAIEIDARRN